MSTGNNARRFARRAQRVMRRLRQRVADESRLSVRVADLEKKFRTVNRQLSDLRTAVARLESGSTTSGGYEAPAHAVSPTPTPVQIGPVETELAPGLERVIAGVIGEHLSYLGVVGLRTLASAVTELEAAGVLGLIVETGTALGGSAIVMATAKSPQRPMKVYDVFGMIPPPGMRDGDDVHRRYETIVGGGSAGLGGETYYGYRADLLAEVTAAFSRHGVPVDENRVELIRGLFEDTITLDEPVALAHLDGDWYESTMTCLTRIVPLLSSGGRVVIDDYDAWSGCRTAVDEYFAGRAGFRFERRGKLHVVRL